MWVLELNDVNIRVLQDGTTKYVAPGIALVERNRFSFGEEANTQFRVNPALCHTHYLQKLYQERIPADRRLPLTQADILYHHLLQIRTHAEIPRNEPVWVVIPSDTSIDQVGLLLSVLRAADYHPIDFLDAGFAAVSLASSLSEAMLLDLGLNRTTVASLSVNSQLEVLDSQTIAGLGLISFVNLWINVIANRSLSESRFDPRAFGETEQQIYEQLLDGILDGSDLLTFNIKYLSENHHVAVLSSDLADAAVSQYELMFESVSNAQNVVLTAFTARLPGLAKFLTEQGCKVAICSEDWSTDVVQRLPMRSDMSAEERNFWREVVVSETPSTETSTTHSPASDEPSHILNGTVAYPLGQSYTVFSDDLTQELFTVEKKDDDWLLEPVESVACELDGKNVAESVHVRAGATIQANNRTFKLISVINA